MSDTPATGARAAFSDLRARMGRDARRVALERFAPERRLPDFLELYRDRQGDAHGR